MTKSIAIIKDVLTQNRSGRTIAVSIIENITLRILLKEAR